MIPKARSHSPFKIIFTVFAVTFLGTFSALIWAKFVPDSLNSTISASKYKISSISNKNENEQKFRQDNKVESGTQSKADTNNNANQKVDSNKDANQKIENDNFNDETREHMKAFPRLYSKTLESPLYEKPFPNIPSDPQKQAAVKEAFIHGFSHYANKCYGSDEYHPIKDSCGNSIHGGLTIIDSISTMIIMNLQDEYQKAKDFVLNQFHIDGSWSLFEFIIRILGSLLSAAEMTGDEQLIQKAISVGQAVYKEVDSKDGMYSSQCSFRTQPDGADHMKDQYSISCGGGGFCLAEVGTYQLEFYALSRLSGESKYITTAFKAYNRLWGQNPDAGLISSHLGAGTDSYYEYIAKGYVMTGGISDELLRHHLSLMKDIRSSLLFKTVNKKLTGHGIKAGTSVDPVIEHLATFVGGMVAVGSVKKNPNHVEDLKLAGELADTYAETYNNFKLGIMPEVVRYNIRNANDKSDMRMSVDSYILRPETVESIYYLWKFTGLQKYRDYNWRIFKAINKSCRVENGFTSISNLNSDTPHHSDKMESFFFAETLKYLYLTFSDSHLISPVDWVFNTEAHPLRVWDQETINKYKV